MGDSSDGLDFLDGLCDDTTAVAECDRHTDGLDNLDAELEQLESVPGNVFAVGAEVGLKIT